MHDMYSIVSKRGIGLADLVQHVCPIYRQMLDGGGLQVSKRTAGSPATRNIFLAMERGDAVPPEEARHCCCVATLWWPVGLQRHLGVVSKDAKEQSKGDMRHKQPMPLNISNHINHHFRPDTFGF